MVYRRPLSPEMRQFPKGRLAAIARHLAQNGVELTLLEVRAPTGINPYIGYLVGMFRIPGDFRKSRADVLLADDLESAVLALLLKWWYRVPMVFDFIDDYSLIASYDGRRLRYRLLKWLEKVIPRRVDRVIAVNPEIRAYCREHGVAEHKVCCVPNGIDTALFRPRTGREKPLDLGAQGEKIILFRGKMNAYYRLDQFLRAVPLVLQRFPGTRFVLVGDGKELGELRRLAVELGIDSALVLPGFVPQADLQRYIIAADVCVYPLPVSSALAVLEYAACARPIVMPKGGTERFGISHELVAEGCVELVENSAEGFSHGIETLLENPGRAEAMGRRAAMIAQRSFRWDHLGRSYEQVLRSAGE